MKIVDGTGVSMPDTPANQALFPQPGTQRPGCGFPIARLAVIFSLASGAILNLAWDSLRVGEGALFRRMWSFLKRRDIILADRGFCSFAELWCLKRRGVDAVMRRNAKRGRGVHVRALGPNDRIVEWRKAKTGPAWMGIAEWGSAPARLRVREIRFCVEQRGFRTRHIEVVTTLLDPIEYPAEAFADLYRRRWMAELSLRDIKIGMGMDVLRCKSPDMIEREIRMFLIAYNLVRTLMVTAAVTLDAPLVRMSFMGTLAKVRQWAPMIAAASGQNDRRRMVRELLEQIAHDPVPHRPDRVEPRAVKRRPKNFARLNKPRHEFREIAHRNRYAKALT